MAITVLDIVNIMRRRGRGDPPAALGDIFVNPLVRVLTFLNSKMDFSRAEQDLDAALNLIDDTASLNQMAIDLNEDVTTIVAKLKAGIDNYASNFGITRRPATTSSGSVLLLRYADPSTVLPITVGSGRRFSAVSINQEYVAQTTIVINAMSYDATYSAFIASVPVQSSAQGLNANAAIGQINLIKDTLVGMDAVTNPFPISGGRDEETDASLVERVKLALFANNIGTSSGYKNLVLGINGVKDTTVIGAGDPLMSRDQGDGGSIDIYITDPVPVVINELADSSNVSLVGTDYIFTASRQPMVKDLDTVSPNAGASQHWDTSVYAGSIRAADGVNYGVSDPTGTVIQYQTNSLVRTVQDFMDDPARKMLGADIMVKEAVFTTVDVIFQIVVLGGYSFNTVKANVEAAVTSFISDYSIGESMDLSDIIKVITETAGVDRVNLPMAKFDKTANASAQQNVITANANEVLRPGTIMATQ